MLSLPPEILDCIVERTDGIPLFVEELTKCLLEGGLLREKGEAYVLDGPLPPLAIPSSLQALLLARLDRLPGVKEVHDLHLWSLTKGSESLSGHLVVLTGRDSAGVLKAGTELLNGKFGLSHVTLQIET